MAEVNDALEDLKKVCHELKTNDTAHREMVLRLQAAIRSHKFKKWGDYDVKDDMDFELYKHAED